MSNTTQASLIDDLKKEIETLRNENIQLKKNQIEIDEAKKLYIGILEDFPALIWRANTEKLCDYFNKVWLDFTGNTMEEEYGNGWAKGVHPDDLDRCIDIYTSNFDKRKSFSMEYRLKNNKGQYRWILDLGRPYYDIDGTFLGYIGSCYDITDKIEYEQKILNEKNRSQHYLDIAGSMIIAFDTKGVITLVNQDCCELLEDLEENIIGKNWFDNYLFEDDLDFVKDIFSKIMTGQLENVERAENYIRTSTGKKRLIAWNNSLLYDENGNIEGVLSSGNDITLQREYEQKIKDQKEEFESIFNYAKNGIAIVNLDGDFLKVNQAFLDITGYNEQEILSMNCTELTTDEYKEINEKALEDTIQKGYVDNIEKACIKKDSNKVNVNMCMSLLPDNKSIILIIHDTTSLKLMQEQAKLASLGEMIGNIAHQWRQPLSLITTGIGALRIKVDLEEEITPNEIVKYCDMINTQADYLSNTIDNFRDFIKGDLTYHNINLSDPINSSINLIKASLDNNYIQLISNIDDDIEIYGNSNELSQAFLNILNNSKDILKENIKNEDNRFIFITTTKIDSNKVQLSIKDTGGGIDDKIIDRVFEPYYTTKHPYVGTGLGLTLAYKIIVDRHQGSIMVENKNFEYKGKKYSGACFSITFLIYNDFETNNSKGI